MRQLQRYATQIVRHKVQIERFEMVRRFVIEKEGLPDLPGMMLATVEALKAIGGSASIQELDEKIIELEGVTEAEQAYLMANNDDRSRASYYLA